MLLRGWGQRVGGVPGSRILRSASRPRPAVARQLDGLAGAHADELSWTVAGFADALAWPDAEGRSAVARKTRQNRAMKSLIAVLSTVPLLRAASASATPMPGSSATSRTC